MLCCAKSLQSCLTLCNSMDCSPPGSSLWNSPGKNPGVGCHFLLQKENHTRSLRLARQCDLQGPHLLLLHFISHHAFLLTSNTCSLSPSNCDHLAILCVYCLCTSQYFCMSQPTFFAYRFLFLSKPIEMPFFTVKPTFTPLGNYHCSEATRMHCTPFL